jgi:lysylphosphatidylglycerol synthetase-like protein (DUF2156 family)
MYPRLLAVFLLLFPASIRAASPIHASIETTLATDGEHLRQLAFDGDKKSYFASDKNAATKDHFSLLLD